MFITPHILQFSLYFYSPQNSVGHWLLLVFFDNTPSSFTFSMLCWPWATTHAVIVLSIFWMNPSILNHPLSYIVKAKRYRWMWFTFLVRQMWFPESGSSTSRPDLTLKVWVQPEKYVFSCPCWFIYSQLMMTELFIYLNSVLYKGFINVLRFHNPGTSDTSLRPRYLWINMVNPVLCSSMLGIDLPNLPCAQKKKYISLYLKNAGGFATWWRRIKMRSFLSGGYFPSWLSHGWTELNKPFLSVRVKMAEICVASSFISGWMK